VATAGLVDSQVPPLALHDVDEVAAAAVVDDVTGYSFSTASIIIRLHIAA
jgi:hypothetical protein